MCVVVVVVVGGGAWGGGPVKMYRVVSHLEAIVGQECCAADSPYACTNHHHIK